MVKPTSREKVCYFAWKRKQYYFTVLLQLVEAETREEPIKRQRVTKDPYILMQRQHFGISKNGHSHKKVVS